MFLPTLLLNIANPRQNGSVWEHPSKNLAVHDPKKLANFYFMNKQNTSKLLKKNCPSPPVSLFRKPPSPRWVGNFPPPEIQTVSRVTCSKTSSAMALGGRITKFSSATFRFTLEKTHVDPVGIDSVPPPPFQKESGFGDNGKVENGGLGWMDFSVLSRFFLVGCDLLLCLKNIKKMLW